MLTNEDKQWISERLEEQRRDVTERVEKVETTLLTEFHKWASPLEMRQRSHAAAIRALDAEVEALDREHSLCIHWWQRRRVPRKRISKRQDG